MQLIVSKEEYEISNNIIEYSTPNIAELSFVLNENWKD